MLRFLIYLWDLLNDNPELLKFLKGLTALETPEIKIGPYTGTGNTKILVFDQVEIAVMRRYEDLGMSVVDRKTCVFLYDYRFHPAPPKCVKLLLDLYDLHDVFRTELERKELETAQNKARAAQLKKTYIEQAKKNLEAVDRDL